MTIQNTSQQNLNVQTIEHGGLTWVNLERPGIAEMDYLRETYGFHDLALDDCLSDIQIPKLDDYGRYLFFVGHFPIFRHDARLTTPSEVDIFSGENFIVTVHDRSLRPLVSLFRSCEEEEGIRTDVIGLGSGYLLYRILDALVDYIFPILNRVIQNMNDIENQVFDDRQRQALRDMALVRLDILTFRRVIRLLNDVLEEMEGLEQPYLKVDTEIFYGDLSDHTRHILVQLEDLKEIVKGFAETQASLAAYRNNDITRTLTVTATILLPFLAVSSLYGMNVPLPLKDEPAAFLIILGAMAAISAGMLIFFRW